MEKYGELVVSEHPDYDEVEQVLEEITRLDFSYEIDDPKKFEVRSELALANGCRL